MLRRLFGEFRRDEAAPELVWAGYALLDSGPGGADAGIEDMILVLGNLLRHVNVGVLPGEARGGNADDGVGLVDHLHGLAEHGAVAVEVALPELVAENDDGLRVLAVDGVRWLNEAAERGGNAEILKGVGAEVFGGNIFRQIGAGDGEVPLVGQDRVFDDGGLAELLPLGGGEREAVGLVFNDLRAHVKHTVGCGVGVGVDEEAPDDAEDGSGGSNAEGERENRGEGEPGDADELPNAVADVLNQRSHGHALAACLVRF